MNILYMEWNSFCNEDMFQVMKAAGHHVIHVPFTDKTESEEGIGKRLDQACAKAECDFVFSFNYFPAVSNACQVRKLIYASWVYDSPHIHAYSYTVINSCNRIFLFDYAMYEELKTEGIPTVYYLPLGVYEKRLSALKISTADRKRYGCDVSFVGSLYTENKHRLYDRFQDMEPFTKGYLDGLIEAQTWVSGYNFLQEMITDEILSELENAYPTDPNSTSVLSPEAIYADYVLARQVTAIERERVLRAVAAFSPVSLYTWQKDVGIPGVENRGPVDYYDTMPYVFACSKINLNISLRSIKTGIPLRAYDIMGCGGFLLTNFQEELPWYFTPGEDFVYYESPKDCAEKVEYYLSHEEERKRIAESGCKKVRQEHTLLKRLETILEVVRQGDAQDETAVI